MRNSGMSEVCCKGVSTPGTARLDLPAHTLDKTTDTFLYVLVYHSNALPPVDRGLSITINAWEHQRAFYRRCSNLTEDSLYEEHILVFYKHTNPHGKSASIKVLRPATRKHSKSLCFFRLYTRQATPRRARHWRFWRPSVKTPDLRMAYDKTPLPSVNQPVSRMTY